METVCDYVAKAREFMVLADFDPWQEIGHCDRVAFITHYINLFALYSARKNNNGGCVCMMRLGVHVKYELSEKTVSGTKSAVVSPTGSVVVGAVTSTASSVKESRKSYDPDFLLQLGRSRLWLLG